MIRVLVADDHGIVREGLKSLISHEPGMEVVGQAENGRRAVELAQDLKPDIVVMDLTMREMSGIEATRQIVAECSKTKVLALSMHSDRRFVAGALAAGACGYLLKDCAFEELARALRAVMAGQVYLSPGIAGTVVDTYVRHPQAAPLSRLSVLTPREREVLQLVAEGKSLKTIASILSVSVKTAETHRQSIMHKLNIESVAGLTKFAIREGLASLED